MTALIAGWVAREADEWGRRTMLLAAFAALLARTSLFAVALGAWFLAGVQVPGGLDAAVIGILTPLVVADCTKGSGRYNVALGAAGMVGGIGRRKAIFPPCAVLSVSVPPQARTA